MNWIILSIITLTLAFHSEAFSADFLEMLELGVMYAMTETLVMLSRPHFQSLYKK